MTTPTPSPAEPSREPTYIHKNEPAWRCGHCENGVIRSLGRDNDEIISDCPECLPLADVINYHAKKTYLFPGSDHYREHVKLNASAAAAQKLIWSLRAKAELADELAKEWSECGIAYVSAHLSMLHAEFNKETEQDSKDFYNRSSEATVCDIQRIRRLLARHAAAQKGSNE